MTTPDTTPRPFRVGFLGGGGIALTHMRHLKAIPGVEIVCAADPSNKNSDEAKTKFGVQRWYADATSMLAAERGNLDAISVCSPNGLHCEHAVAASQAGLHVLVEKPMARNAAECQRMNAAAKKAGKAMICGFQWRFDPRAEALRAQYDAGVFGAVRYVRVQALRRRGIPNWGVFGRKDLQGGGPLIDIGVHVAEMAHYVCGAPRPTAASGQTFTYLGNQPMQARCQWPNWDHATYTVEDLAVGMVRFANGMVMVIESSFAAHIEKEVWNFQVMGERGGATFEPIQVFTDHDGYMWNQTPAFVGKEQGWDPAFAAKMRHFVAVCRDGAPNRSSGEDGECVQLILDGIYQSAESGREVVL